MQPKSQNQAYFFGYVVHFSDTFLDIVGETATIKTNKWKKLKEFYEYFTKFITGDTHVLPCGGNGYPQLFPS